MLAGTKLTNEDLRKVPEAVRGRLELLELVVRYRAAKRSRDLFDFSDQIALSAQLATTRPEVGALLREEFRVVLLDEYQDTSVAQRLLLSGLFGAGSGHAVTAVGDPCQAIYGWRGASVANLDDFPEHFPHADGTPATRLSLSENRRSGGRLLDLANGLAAPLRAMHEGVEALRPAPGAEAAGQVRCALLETHAQELDWLADSVAHLVRTGTEPREIAVLCRSAGDFAQIQAVLVDRDVPVEVVGLSGLLHLPEVADLVAVCEVLQDPGANASLVRLLIGPRWRIGARDLALLGRRARLLVSRAPAGSDPDERLAAAVEGVDPAEIVSLADALETFLDGAGQAPDDLPFSAEARIRFAHLAQELRDLRRSLADPLMDVLHRVLTATGLEVELSASPHALAARRRETLSNFMDVAAGFAALDGEATLLAFLAFLRTAAQYEKGLDHALPGGENTVKVLTAHKSKGLEWDVVVVPDLCAGAFPKEKPPEAWTSYAKVLPYALRGDAPTLPGDPAWTSAGLKAFKAALKDHKSVEELRLGYVTFTRPRSLLLASGHWWGPSQKKRRGPSPFLEALYEHCAAGFGEIEAWADEPDPTAENPALSGESTADHSWPLPLDPYSLTLRRAAAALVESYLAAPPPEEDEYLWPPDCEEPWPDEAPWEPDPADGPWPQDAPAATRPAEPTAPAPGTRPSGRADGPGTAPAGTTPGTAARSGGAWPPPGPDAAHATAAASDAPDGAGRDFDDPWAGEAWAPPGTRHPAAPADTAGPDLDDPWSGEARARPGHGPAGVFGPDFDDPWAGEAWAEAMPRGRATTPAPTGPGAAPRFREGAGRGPNPRRPPPPRRTRISGQPRRPRPRYVPLPEGGPARQRPPTPPPPPGGTAATSFPKRPAPSPPGTAISTPSRASSAVPARPSVTSSCRPPCPPASCSGSPPTSRASCATSPGPCRGPRSPPPARAPGSTPGSSPGSTSCRCRSSTSSTPSPTSPAQAPTRRSSTRPTSTPSRPPSNAAPTRTGPPPHGGPGPGHPRRPGRARPDRRRLPQPGRLVRDRRLEDRPHHRGRPAPARRLPRGLGRGHEHPARPGLRRLPARPQRPRDPPPQPPGPRPP